MAQPNPIYRQTPNDAVREARTDASLNRATSTTAAEAAKTAAKNRLTMGYPKFAGAQYSPHANTVPVQPGASSTGSGPGGTTGSLEPMNRADGSFNPQSSMRPAPIVTPEPRMISTMPHDSIAPPASGNENPEQWANIRATNSALYRTHDPVAAPDPMGKNSPAVQGALDAVNGVTRTPVAGVGTQQTPFGTASATFSNTPQTAARPIYDTDGKTVIGLEHPSPNDPTGNAASRIALQQSHPEVFQDGTPQNQAFAAYANKYGESEAHKNIGTILGTTAGQTPGSSPGKSINGVTGSAPISVPKTMPTLDPYS